MIILEHFQGEPWPHQVAALERVETAVRGGAQVVVLQAAVATGKSKMLDCIARWATSRHGGKFASSVIVPNNNALVKQYLADLKGYAEIHRGDSYQCHQGGSCHERKARIGGYCRSQSGSRYASDACALVRDLGAVRSAKRAVANQHLYMAHKLYRDVVAFDEAHTLGRLLAEAASTTYWRSKWQWPRELHSAADVATWVATRDESELQSLRDVLSGFRGDVAIQCGSEALRGRETEFVRLLPLDYSSQTHLIAPSSVRLVVLASATISKVDVRSLGLADRAIAYIRVDSPIPPERRPLVLHDVAPGTWAARPWARPRLLAALWDVLDAHPTERGLIHASYSLSADIAAAAPEHIRRRLVTHTSADRMAKIEHFLTATGGDDNRVLVGVDCSEGLDLRDDWARFQIIPEVQRPYMADPGNLWLAQHEPARYEWLSVLRLAQQYGRVCRHAADYGVTHVLDSTVHRELRSTLAPEFLTNAIVRGTNNMYCNPEANMISL